MSENKKISVLIVDDSRIFRSLVEEGLKKLGDIEVIGSVRNGVKALEFIQKRKPDVVTLDVEMPDMDGLATLKEIQKINQRDKGAPIQVVMLSAFTQEGAASTIAALEKGAFDFIPKPASNDVEKNVAILQRQLGIKVRSAMGVGRPEPKFKKEVHPRPIQRYVKASSPTTVSAILIGVSTGGPQALSKLLPELCKITDLPILIVQHMPETFTESLAKNLNKRCEHTVVEAFSDLVVQPKHIYIAPGGRHLILKEDKGEILTVNTRQPLENGCRPAADVLFRSAASIFQGQLLALILTGMGNDGTKGLGVLKRKGAYVIAQDEPSSVVWGMPGSAVEAGVVDEVLPLEKMPGKVANLVRHLD